MRCEFHWDSLMSDSAHRHWHLSGMRGWNGSSWASISGAAFAGPLATFQSTLSYSAIAFVGTSSVTEVAAQNAVPAEYKLMQNYPNPFNPSTNITFALPRTMNVRLDVFNILGQNVATLANGVESSGTHTVRFDGAALPSGIYFYRLQAGEFGQTKRFILVK